MALKKTGKVWVSTHEKDRLRCQGTDLERETSTYRDNKKNYQLVFKEKFKNKANLLNVGLIVKVFECFKCPNPLGKHVFIPQAFVALYLASARLPSDVPD